MPHLDGVPLGQKVKNALDEARILVLGTQVLMGFQFRAFFETGYENLDLPSRLCELIGLAALLVTIGALFLAPARHQIVERGNSSARFHRLTMKIMVVALGAFTVAIAADLFIAGGRVLGTAGAVGLAILGVVAAVTLWYGQYLHRDRRPHSGSEDEVEKTPLDQRIVQVLTETRVVLPGAQTLLGFQLAMVLMESFGKLPARARIVHLCSIAVMAIATMVLMAPAAYHRIVERGEDTERFHRFASRMVLTALALLAISFAGDVYVVLVKAGHARVAIAGAVVTVVAFYSLWFGVTLVLRAKQREGSSGAG